jgi:RNA polymerase sigma-70 factor (ECF subfamily)
VGPDELGRLLDRYAAPLALYARQWCDLPEDVVQEAFVKLAGQRPPPAHPVAWLYRAVRNAALTAGRSARRRRRHEARAAERAPPWFEPAPGAALDGQAAAAALLGLPAEQREVIVAHLWGGLSFSQIGDLVGASASTVHRWYAAGLAALRERLGVPCPNPPTS